MRARSAAEFVTKLEAGSQELEESLSWMELLIESGVLKDEQVTPLMQEANELMAIMITSVRTTKLRSRRE